MLNNFADNRVACDAWGACVMADKLAKAADNRVACDAWGACVIADKLQAAMPTPPGGMPMPANLCGHPM